LALTLAAATARAEPIYVIEQLVVSVTSEPGADSERIGQVKSGDRLELLEREGDEAHVRLPSGKEGWLKASYLSNEEPLQHRLTERTAEVEQLKQEAQTQKQEGEKLKRDIGRLESDLAAARVAHNAASAPAPTPPPAANTPTQTVPPAVTETVSGSSAPIRETVFLRSPERSGQTPWPWVLGTSAVMLLAGFVLGWKTLDRRIRQKYGGLRIY
jgi:TolA-binding protein